MRVHAGPTRFRPGGRAACATLFWAVGPFYRPPRRSFNQCPWSVALLFCVYLYLYLRDETFRSMNSRFLAEGVSSARPVYLLGYVPSFIYSATRSTFVSFFNRVFVSVFRFACLLILLYIHCAGQSAAQPLNFCMVWVPCRAVPQRVLPEGECE